MRSSLFFREVYIQYYEKKPNENKGDLYYEKVLFRIDR